MTVRECPILMASLKNIGVEVHLIELKSLV